MEKDNTFTLALVVLVVLIGLGGWMLWRLLKIKPVEVKAEPRPAPTQTQVLAKKDLGAYVLLKGGDLDLRPGTDDSTEALQKAPTIEELSNRYLMFSISGGEEVKREMVAPPEATSLLADAVAVSIPATPGSTLGGQLRVGDLIDVVAVRSSSGTPSPAGSDQPTPRTFEKLLVLNIDTKEDVKADEKAVGERSAITLAVPSNKRDEFASAVAGATVMVTRQIVVRN